MPSGQNPHITPEFCKETKQRLLFKPKTLSETQFIADQLLGMGYAYYRADMPGKLEQALKGAIYLDVDKTIMVVESPPTEQILPCSVDDFKQFFVPEAPRDENARLSDDDCRRRTLAFYPRTNNEARAVLSTLMTAGVTPPTDDFSAAQMMAHAIVYGVLVRDGRMSFGPRPQDLIGAEICSAIDLGIRAGITLSPEQATIMAAFNEMGARMEQMSQRIARLEEAVLPQEIAKPLPKPKR